MTEVRNRTKARDNAMVLEKSLVIEGIVDSDEEDEERGSEGREAETESEMRKSIEGKDGTPMVLIGLVLFFFVFGTIGFCLFVLDDSVEHRDRLIDAPFEKLLREHGINLTNDDLLELEDAVIWNELTRCSSTNQLFILDSIDHVSAIHCESPILGTVRALMFDKSFGIEGATIVTVCLLFFSFFFRCLCC